MGRSIMRGSQGWIFNAYVTQQGKFYWLGCTEGTESEVITMTYVWIVNNSGSLAFLALCAHWNVQQLQVEKGISWRAALTQIQGAFKQSDACKQTTGLTKCLKMLLSHIYSVAACTMLPLGGSIARHQVKVLTLHFYGSLLSEDLNALSKVLMN